MITPIDVITETTVEARFLDRFGSKRTVFVSRRTTDCRIVRMDQSPTTQHQIPIEMEDRLTEGWASRNFLTRTREATLKIADFLNARTAPPLNFRPVLFALELALFDAIVQRRELTGKLEQYTKDCWTWMPWTANKRTATLKSVVDHLCKNLLKRCTVLQQVCLVWAMKSTITRRKLIKVPQKVYSEFESHNWNS